MKKQNISLKLEDDSHIKRMRATSQHNLKLKFEKPLENRRQSEDERTTTERAGNTELLNSTSKNMSILKDRAVNYSFRLKRKDTKLNLRNNTMRTELELKLNTADRGPNTLESLTARFASYPSRSLSPIKLNVANQSVIHLEEGLIIKEESISPSPVSPQVSNLLKHNETMVMSSNQSQIQAVSSHKVSSHGRTKSFTQTFFGNSIGNPVKVQPFESSSIHERKESLGNTDNIKREVNFIDCHSTDLARSRINSQLFNENQYFIHHSENPLISVREADIGHVIFTGKQRNKMTRMSETLGKNNNNSKNMLPDLRQILDQRSQVNSNNVSRLTKDNSNKYSHAKRALSGEISSNTIMKLSNSSSKGVLERRLKDKIQTIKDSDVENSPATVSQLSFNPVKLLEAAINRQKNPQVRTRVMNNILLLKNK